jgi:oligopeptide/dipeptide ABC transporter ATP-binding protein
LIVADEPLSALDVSIQAQLLNLLESLRRTRSLSMIFISHDMTVVEYLCNRVVVMYLGCIVEEAEAGELFRSPLHPYTRSLIAAVPRMERREQAETAMLRGEIPNPGDPIHGCPFASRCPQVESLCRAEVPPLIETAPGRRVSCHNFTPHFSLSHAY